jgi:chromosomal replication initiation ATPase DnaA
MLLMDELTRKKLIIEQVCDVVCTQYGIDINRVFSDDRHKGVSDARIIIVYILHKDFGLTTPFLAQEFNRSTSWVLKKCAIKKQHITMYEDCAREHDRFLKLLKNDLSL